MLPCPWPSNDVLLWKPVKHGPSRVCCHWQDFRFLFDVQIFQSAAGLVWYVLVCYPEIPPSLKFERGNQGT